MTLGIEYYLSTVSYSEELRSRLFLGSVSVARLPSIKAIFNTSPFQSGLTSIQNCTSRSLARKSTSFLRDQNYHNKGRTGSSMIRGIFLEDLLVTSQEKSRYVLFTRSNV